MIWYTLFCSMNVQTLQVYSKENDGELFQVIESLAMAGKKIAKDINRAGLIDLLGLTGEVNVQGEEVKKLDEFSNKVFEEELGKSGAVAGYASEENEGVVDYSNSGQYIVSVDPLDGSSNIDANVSVGSIFSVLKRISRDKVSEVDFLQKGSEQVMAGYFLYGSSTMLVYSTGSRVNGFTKDPDTGDFILSHENIKTPEEGIVYSINESYSLNWDSKLTKYIELLKGKKYKARYIGSLVSDFHRNLLYGGIYVYPADSKNVDGKLRLVYECNPIAFVVTQAGGRATNGDEDILDIIPTKVHQRTPFYVGSKGDIELWKEVDQK
ncbi:class 1 fructose-bisphosphatase [Candidatus Roizmanbacteria bacterium CG22_combo_CG10-13_8_21_14_all_38_20]|uniref:Fructose-1,6-bisphosphatase class 1 n=1 Tax=Candidatus Roizmanbacteria bacterium CG22_combo_CG10-13_8_21_14_all_38_20 TaxID=1974862 RepID=A0A2H0BV44_9BACT|nr:MAG: class 1 fructose-bisphosphatase [Candidatus Roizmanbacteria bacterium CG22_combo_CG10-13_8_21_14_all_38_20]PJC31501.1 MAG: class 1 fructose-bisphosphatase [Candidatus Roizmanbacteria bacterium CG_4_9_14_0_2_um_filter_38_17]